MGQALLFSVYLGGEVDAEAAGCGQDHTLSTLRAVSTQAQPPCKPPIYQAVSLTWVGSSGNTLTFLGVGIGGLLGTTWE